MPRNGSGTMSLVYNWADDQTNGIKILASRMMTQQTDIADEITNLICDSGILVEAIMLLAKVNRKGEKK